MKLRLRKEEIPKHLRKYFKPIGYKQGDLIQLPNLVAEALREDGWILRDDVIWAKAISFNDKYSGSTMPESVNGWRWERCRVRTNKIRDRHNSETITEEKGRHCSGHMGNYSTDGLYIDCPGCEKCNPNDGYVLRKGSWRCTKAHEHIFQFVKTNDYFCDMEAVREEHASDPNKIKPAKGVKNVCDDKTGKMIRFKPEKIEFNPSGRNLRDVWTINPQPYPDSHYATFPESLVEPCIKVGTSEKGCCPKCGSQWARIVDSKRTFQSGCGKSGNMPNGKHGPDLQGGGETLDVRRGPCVETTTIGWKPTCDCGCEETSAPIVFDPFMGSGTVAAVAAKLGRNYCGSELSKDYLENQAKYRVQEAETGISKQELRAGQKALFE